MTSAEGSASADDDPGPPSGAPAARPSAGGRATAQDAPAVPRPDAATPERAGPARVTVAGGYWRDDDGRWHRADGSVVVATDLRLGDLYDPPEAEHEGRAVRVVPRAWARRHPDHPLAWVFAHAPTGERGPVLVPADEWSARAYAVVGLLAPELHPTQLVGVDGAAALADVTPATIRAYLARGRLPEPVTRVGGSPVWPRATIEQWAGARRRRPRRADQD